MIRVLCCNLYSGNADAPALANMIDEASIDVLCAQELTPGLAAAISAELPHGDLSHDQIRRGSGIAARHPVVIDRISMSKRDGWIARMLPTDWPSLSEAIEVFNVHVSAPHLWPYFPSPVRRRHQLDAILNNFEDKCATPHAVVGDFNSTPAWPLYSLLKRVYEDGLERFYARRGERPPNTWPNWPGLGIQPSLRIDHCFLRGLTLRHADVIEIVGSDHMGLVLELATTSGGSSTS